MTMKKIILLLLLQFAVPIILVSGDYCNTYVVCTKTRYHQVKRTTKCGWWWDSECSSYSQTSSLYTAQCQHTECCKGYTGTTCSTDIDECSENNGGCSNTCVNLPGTYRCECEKGLELKPDGKTCQDKNECMVNNGGCSQICQNDYKTFRCECKTGYQLGGDNRTCHDINECLVQNGGCSNRCVNLPGTYRCECDDGLTLKPDGKTCQDINECLAQDNGCSQICKNDFLTYRCECMSGYQLGSDKKTCYDIDECSRPNQCTQTCHNTLGSYQCDCRAGYTLDHDGHTCIDIDDCVSVVCKNGGSCVDGVQSVTCLCLPGFEGNFCEKDVNECSILNGGCEEKCVNTHGSFKCDCENGFQSDGACIGNGTSEGTDENIFQVHKIARKLLPKGCAVLEIMSCGDDGRNRTIMFTSTADWYRHKYNNSIHYTYGVVFVDTGVVSIPVSISGLEVVHTASGIQLGFRALTYSESIGEKLSNKRTDNCYFFPITPRDIQTMIASFLPTVFDNLYATLPDWIRFSSSGSTVLSITDVRTDLIYGKDIETLPECRGAPVYEDHLYNVFRFGSGLKIEIFENELDIPSQIAGNKFCFLVDFCEDNAGTVFVLFPPESRDFLQNFDVFKSLYESTGLQIRPQGVALSLQQNIFVNGKTHILKFWNGNNDFTYRISTSANVWLASDLRWSYEEDYFSFLVDTKAEIFTAVPDISTLLTGIFLDEWNILLQVRTSATLKLKFKLFNKDIEMPFDVATAGLDAYMSLGGNEERQICGETANPEGAFVSMFLRFHPFRDVDIMKDWKFDVSVKVYAFFTTNPGNILTQNTTINIFTDIVNLSNVIKRFGNLLLNFLHKMQNDMSTLLERALTDLHNVVQYLETLLSKYLTEILSDPRQVINALRDIWKCYVSDFKKTYQVVFDTVEFDSSYVAFQMKEFLENETLNIKQNIRKTMDKVRNQLFTVVDNYKGFGFKYTAEIDIMKLGFGRTEIEFLYSVEKLEQCSQFKKAYDLLKGEKSAKILARVIIGERLGYFLTVERHESISLALGISSGNFVGHLSLYVTALGLKARGEAFISNDGLIIYVEGDVWGIFVARIQLSTVLGKRWFDLTFNVKGHLGVRREKREVGWVTDDKDFGGSYLGGLSSLIQKATQAANERFEYAKKKLTDAQDGLSNAQGKISEAQQKVWSANSAFDKAVQAMDGAKEKLEMAKEPFEKALETLRNAQRRVDTVCRMQSCHDVCVPGVILKWCSGWGWGYPCFKSTNCMLRVPNVPCHLANAGCAVIRGVAYVALEAAQIFVRAPMLALDIAQAAVSVAQVVVDKSRVVLVLANGVLEVAKLGLEAAKGVLEIAKTSLTAVKFIVGAALHVFDMIVQYGLKSLLDIRNCGFEMQLTTTDKAFFDVSCELQAFRLGWHKFEFEFDFRNPVLSMMRVAKSTVDTLLEMVKNVIGKRKRREISFKTMTTLHHIVHIYKRDVSRKNGSTLFQEFDDGNITSIQDSEIFMKTKFKNRIEYFSFNCDSFSMIHAFFTEAVDFLHAMSNESVATMTDIADFKMSFLNNATTFNLTTESVGINMEYAFQEFNMTSDDIQSALQNVSNSPYATFFSTMSNVSGDTLDILDSQLNEAHTISLMDHWILGMTNTTKDYFNETHCSGFKDCVMYSFLALHDLFIDDSIPGVDKSRNITLDLENSFLELLSNDSWSIVESNNRSIAILHELERLNETNIWCSEAPSASVDYTYKTFLYGTSMHISCRVSGAPKPTTRWYLNNTLIENANESELRVMDLDHRNGGLYKCEAENIVTKVLSDVIEVHIKECMPGSFFDLDHCELCSSGFYQFKRNQLDCIKCPDGFTTKATGAIIVLECIDINECSDEIPACEHRCENTNGSFTCSCNNGYQLLKDRKSCAAIESSIYVPIVAAAVSGVAAVIIISLVVYKIRVYKASKHSANGGNVYNVQQTERNKSPIPIDEFPATRKHQNNLYI